MAVRRIVGSLGLLFGKAEADAVLHGIEFEERIVDGGGRSQENYAAEAVCYMERAGWTVEECILRGNTAPLENTGLK
jgi:hypothetical protein